MHTLISPLLADVCCVQQMKYSNKFELLFPRIPTLNHSIYPLITLLLFFLLKTNFMLYLILFFFTKSSVFRDSELHFDVVTAERH